MVNSKPVSNDDLARIIKKGFDAVTNQLHSVQSGVDDLRSGQKTMTEILVGISNDIDELTTICKNGFDDTPTRQEFNTFKKTVLDRQKIFAKKLKVKFADIDHNRV